jgi:hypothetical protein
VGFGKEKEVSSYENENNNSSDNIVKQKRPNNYTSYDKEKDDISYFVPFKIFSIICGELHSIGRKSKGEVN